MVGEYEIKVSLTPNFRDNKIDPYFWAINYWQTDLEEWCTRGCGWANTPVKAWEEALYHYTQFKIAQGR